jgi:hypothetical protein
MLDAVVVTILFVALIPGVFFTLSKRSSKNIIILTHSVLFFILYLLLKRSREGFQTLPDGYELYPPGNKKGRHTWNIKKSQTSNYNGKQGYFTADGTECTDICESNKNINGKCVKD